MDDPLVTVGLWWNPSKRCHKVDVIGIGDWTHIRDVGKICDKPGEGRISLKAEGVHIGYVFKSMRKNTSAICKWYCELRSDTVLVCDDETRRLLRQQKMYGAEYRPQPQVIGYIVKMSCNTIPLLPKRKTYNSSSGINSSTSITTPFVPRMDKDQAAIVKNIWTSLQSERLINQLVKYMTEPQFSKAAAAGRLGSLSRRVINQFLTLIKELSYISVGDKLRNLASTHYSYGVSEHQWGWFGQTMTEILRSEYGDHMTPEIEQQWSSAWSFMLVHLICGYKREVLRRTKEPAGYKRREIALSSRCILNKQPLIVKEAADELLVVPHLESTCRRKIPPGMFDGTRRLLLGTVDQLSLGGSFTISLMMRPSFKNISTKPLNEMGVLGCNSVDDDSQLLLSLRDRRPFIIFNHEHLTCSEIPQLSESSWNHICLLFDNKVGELTIISQGCTLTFDVGSTMLVGSSEVYLGAVTSLPGNGRTDTLSFFEGCIGGVNMIPRCVGRSWVDVAKQVVPQFTSSPCARPVPPSAPKPKKRSRHSKTKKNTWQCVTPYSTTKLHRIFPVQELIKGSKKKRLRDSHEVSGIHPAVVSMVPYYYNPKNQRIEHETDQANKVRVTADETMNRFGGLRRIKVLHSDNKEQFRSSIPDPLELTDESTIATCVMLSGAGHLIPSVSQFWSSQIRLENGQGGLASSSGIMSLYKRDFEHQMQLLSELVTKSSCFSNVPLEVISHTSSDPGIRPIDSLGVPQWFITSPRESNHKLLFIAISYSDKLIDDVLYKCNDSIQFKICDSIGGSVTVHETVALLTNKIKNQISQALTAIVGNDESISDNVKIIFTGHGIAGAISQLLCLSLFNKRMTCVSFGSPGVFCNHISDELSKSITNFIVEGDMVPTWNSSSVTRDLLIIAKAGMQAAALSKQTDQTYGTVGLVEIIASSSNNSQKCITDNVNCTFKKQSASNHSISSYTKYVLNSLGFREYHHVGKSIPKVKNITLSQPCKARSVLFDEFGSIRSETITSFETIITDSNDQLQWQRLIAGACGAPAPNHLVSVFIERGIEYFCRCHPDIAVRSLQRAGFDFCCKKNDKVTVTKNRANRLPDIQKDDLLQYVELLEDGKLTPEAESFIDNVFVEYSKRILRKSSDTRTTLPPAAVSHFARFLTGVSLSQSFIFKYAFSFHCSLTWTDVLGHITLDGFREIFRWLLLSQSGM